MLASGGSCCEARISHVWAGFREKIRYLRKLDKST
jgi:hypothetical protein